MEIYRAGLFVILHELDKRRKRADSDGWANAAHHRLMALVAEVSALSGVDRLDAEGQARLFDKLLDVGRSTVSGSPEFAHVVYSQAARLRPKSRAALRGLARAAEGSGDVVQALGYWEAFQQATSSDSHVDEKVSVLRRYEEARRDLMQSLDDVAAGYDPRARDVDPWRIALRDLAREDDPFALIDSDPIGLQEIVAKSGFQSLVRPAAEYLLARAVVAATKPCPYTPESFMSAFDLREWIDGKRVCMVANAASLEGGRRGPFIDSHDIVVRFNSFRRIVADTGSRLDVHVAIHLHDFNLEEFTTLRIILGNSPSKWENRIRSLDPDNQQWIGDDSLRYPLYDSRLCNERMEQGAPTSGYNMIRLLHLFSNFSELHLVGFDGYVSGPLRVDEAMHLPHASIHDSLEEQAWIEAHAERVDDLTLRVRPLFRHETERAAP